MKFWTKIFRNNDCTYCRCPEQQHGLQIVRGAVNLRSLKQTPAMFFIHRITFKVPFEIGSDFS
ncbi:hypothetical protein MZ16F91_22460 [Escherichia coli]